jgi:hypothetical protein
MKILLSYKLKLELAFEFFEHLCYDEVGAATLLCSRVPSAKVVAAMFNLAVIGYSSPRMAAIHIWSLLMQPPDLTPGGEETVH